jgi:signal transduction histidine kinase
MNDSELFHHINPVVSNHLNLAPYAELAKLITNSPVCEIDIMDKNYHGILQDIETDSEMAPLRKNAGYETIRKNVAHEIVDFSKISKYKNLAGVKGPPWLRHYFGVKLTTSAGKVIGTLSVFDSVSKRISKVQKVQFKLLAHSLMMTIESEFRHRIASEELDTLRDHVKKLNHDVHSPVSGIIMMADLLIEDIEEVKVQALDIQMIKESAQSIVDIINGVMASWDADKNKEKLLKSVPLSNVLDKIETLYKPLAQNKNLSLSVINQTDINLRVPYYFSIKLVRIIGNLVSNAVKFSPENGSVEVLISRQSKLNRSMLNITISNSGKSISLKQIAAFNSGDPVARSNETDGEMGFGLGLQHVHQMITEEGGSVTIETENGSGTRFSISLPLPTNEKNTAHKIASVLTNGFPKPAVNGTRY